MSPPIKKTFDELWDELDHLPDEVKGEIVGGEIVLLPRPGHPHTVAASDLGGLLIGRFRFGIGGPGGWVILHEPGIRFGDEMRIPDLAGWRAERFVVPPEARPYTVAPDWICEVLSTSTVRTDRAEKLPLYAAHGVQHVWLIDPEAQTLEVYRLQQDHWLLLATHGGAATGRAEPFDAVELDLAMLWGSPLAADG